MLGVASIRHAQLPVAIGLVQYGTDHLVQKLQRRIVERYHNAEFDIPGKPNVPLGFQFFFCEQRLIR